MDTGRDQGIRAQLLRVRDALAMETREMVAMLDTYRRYLGGSASPEELEAAGEQMREILKGTALGAVLLAPGSFLVLPILLKLARRYDVELLPSSFRAKKKDTEGGG